MRAAVLTEAGAAGLAIRDDLRAARLRPGFVRVRVRAAGVCHSDLSAISGRLGLPTPVVVGHESSGEVAEVGEGVTAFDVGDRVVVSWIPQCGSCAMCVAERPQLCTFNTSDAYRWPRYADADGDVWAQAGVGGFAEELVVSEHNLVPLPDDVPFDVGAIIGCGVSTGVGTVMNTAKVAHGDAVIVIGCGGVGLSAVQAARAAGASAIVAIDPMATKRDLAVELGATHAFAPDDVSSAIEAVTGGVGFDVAVEAVGAVATIRTAYDAIRRGGTAVVAGVGPKDQEVPFSPYELYAGEKRLIGSVFGSTDIRRDFPAVMQLWRDGTLDLERLISARVPLERLPEALDELRTGEALRSIVVFD